MQLLDSFDSIMALLDRRAAASPEQIAFAEKDAAGKWQTISWAQFNLVVSDLAGKLSNIGMTSGDQVAILMPNCIRWEIIQHAVYRLGGIVIGLDVNDTPRRMLDIFSLCSPRFLFIDRSTRLSHIPCQIQKAFERIIVDLADNDSYADMCATLPSFAGRTSYPSVTGEMTATIFFTSGTTGSPKLISYQHRQLIAAVQAMVRSFKNLPVQAHTACWLPLANSFQRIINFCAMAMNWKAFMVPSPAAIMTHVNEIQPHLFAAVPRFYEKFYDGISQQQDLFAKPKRFMTNWACHTGKMYRKAAANGKPPSWFLKCKYGLAERLVLEKIRNIMGRNLRYFISGSASLSLELLEAFGAIGWTILECYGISENIIPVAMNVPGHIKPGSVGRPFPENTIRIAADDEILVKGPGVTSNTASALTSDGFLKTGDLGALDEDGYLYFIGRKADMFKLSTGRKVIPGEIERALNRIDAVEYSIALGENRNYVAAVLVIPDEKWRQLKKRYRTTKCIQTYLHRQARYMCAHLPSYCRPVEIAIINDCFSPQTGEVTVNLNLRRHVVIEKYTHILNRLHYSDKTVVSSSF